MENLLRGWEGEFAVVRHDREADAWVFIAIHSTRLGPAVGGTRMKMYGTPAEGLRDAQRLAEGMTYKWAGIDFPLGGGKAVIALSRPLDSGRESLLERYGSVIENLRGLFGTGVDMGITSQDVDVMARSTGHVFGRTPENGGSGDPGPWTALGVLTGMRAAARQVWGTDELGGRSVLIQGVGGVGAPLARQLKEAGAELKLADVDPARAEEAAEALGGSVVGAEAAFEEPCDIFAPCAVGGVLEPATISSLQCRVVAGSANNQLEAREDAGRLHEGGILYAPDFVINAGGAIAHAGFEALDMSEVEVRDRVLAIGESLDVIFDEAASRGESPVHAAERRARAILERGPRPAR